MSERAAGATDRFGRLLVLLLPRSLRRDFGDDMVQLACDRRRHGGEPIWRLWPSLVADVSSTAVRTHWEDAVFPTRAVLIGIAFSISVLAVMSRDPLVAVVIVGIVGIAAWRTRPTGPVDVDAKTGLAWIVAGVALCIASPAAVTLFSDHDLSPLGWMAFILSLLLGLVAVGTGLALAFDRRSGRKVVGRPTR